MWNLKRVVLYRWFSLYISLLHASVIELICISSVKIKHLPSLAHLVHVTNLHLFAIKLWNKHFRNATFYLRCKNKNFTTKMSTLWLAVLLIIRLKYFYQFLKTSFWLRLVYTHSSYLFWLHWRRIGWMKVLFIFTVSCIARKWKVVILYSIFLLTLKICSPTDDRAIKSFSHL